MNIQAKDLTKVAPRSAYELLGGFAILARAIDKGRADIAGTNGEYNFDCPVDNMLLSFKGIKGSDFREYLKEGHTDSEVVEWFKSNGIQKTDEEVSKWSSSFKSDFSYSTDPQKSGWFIGECKRLNLDPKTTTLFNYLDVDDRVSFKA